MRTFPPGLHPGSIKALRVFPAWCLGECGSLRFKACPCGCVHPNASQHSPRERERRFPVFLGHLSSAIEPPLIEQSPKTSIPDKILPTLRSKRGHPHPLHTHQPSAYQEGLKQPVTWHRVPRTCSQRDWGQSVGKSLLK